MSRNSILDVQFDADGQLRHLLTIDGLNAKTIIEILDTAESFISIGQRQIRKVPLLHGRTVVNLFLSPVPARKPRLRLPPSACRPMSLT